MVKCLAHTQGSKVRVNAVLPGLLLTEWVSSAIAVVVKLGRGRANVDEP